MGESINITEYLEIFKKRKKVIFVILLIFILAGGLLQFKHSRSYVPMYSSTVSLRINTAKNSQQQTTSETDGDTKKKSSKNKDNDSDEEEKSDTKDTQSNSSTSSLESQYYYASSSLQSSTLNQSIAEKYSSLAVSKRAMNELIETLGLKETTSSLASSITVTPQENLLEFIDITVVNTNRELAQKIAETVPTVFNNEMKRVIGIDCVEVLYNPTQPYIVPKAQDNTFRNFTIIGIVLAIFVVLLLECVDNKIVTPDDAENYWGLPVIGVVPFQGENAKGKKQKASKQGA